MDTSEMQFHYMELQEGESGECILLMKDEDSSDFHNNPSTEDYTDKVINISNSDDICQSCQTENLEFISTSFVVNIPYIFCSQPIPGEASTQCNLPLMVDSCVGTEDSSKSTQCYFSLDDQNSDSGDGSGVLQQYSLKASSLNDTDRTVLGVTNKDANFELMKKGTNAKRGRPKGSYRRGRSFKFRRKALEPLPKPKDDLSDVAKVSLYSNSSKMRSGRQRTKKKDADFEYDFEDSEENLDVMLHDDNDDNGDDQDWEGEHEGLNENEVQENIKVPKIEVIHLEIKKDEFVERDENINQLWRAKSEGDQLEDLFDSSKVMNQDAQMKKEELDEDLDYKSLIDAVVWKDELGGNNDEALYSEENETQFTDEKQIQAVEVNDLIHDKCEKQSQRLKRYAEKSRVKYQQEKVVKDDGKRVYKCLKCNKEFHKRLLLNQHRKVHSRKTQTYKCSQCGRIFHEARKYYSHLSFHERIFECRTCERKFSLLANLKKHIIIHQDAPLKVCEVCGSQFSSEDELKVHHEAQHGEDDIPSYVAKCEYCNREYRREEAYQQHLAKAPYNCPTCCKSFGCEFEQKKHVRYEHDQCVCEFCGKSFKTNSILSHIKIMHKEAQVKCPHCPKKFVYRSKMLSHIDSSHNVEKKYKCNLCSYSAKTVNSLNLHRRKCHMDPKKFPWYECNICNRKFYLPSKLTLHYRAHTGEKPFACQTCNKTFACKYNMKEHERAVHGERIEVKNSDGSTQIQLVKHRRAPRSSRRRCDLCGIDFPSSASIVEHMKKVHAPQAEQLVGEVSNVKVSVKFEPQGEAGDKCLGYEVIGNASDVILSDSSSMMNIRADEIPENATLVEIDGVEYQVVRQ